MRRLTIALLITATPAAMLLGGCGSDDHGATTAPSTVAATPAPALTGSTGDAPSSPPAGAQSGSDRCHTSGLKVTVGADAGGGAAGTSYDVLVFTNTGNRACTLHGYPVVSYVAGDQGAQINDPFQRQDGSAATVHLKPGAAGHASIGLPNYRNIPVADCKPTAIRGFRVYPPDETAAVFVSRPMTVCSAKGQGVGLVLPIEAGSDAA